MTASPNDNDGTEQSDGRLEDEYGVSHGDDLEPGDVAPHGVGPDERRESALSDNLTARMEYMLSHQKTGHYWDHHDEDAPDWWSPRYVEGQHEDTLPPERQPDVPDDVDWTQYKSYYCWECKAQCINHIDTVYAQDDYCRHCWTPDVDERVPTCSDGPAGATDEDVREAVQRAESDD